MRSCPIKILLDTGSQRTYISERIVRKLQLQPYRSQEMTVKAFGEVEGKCSIFNEYQFCVRNPKRECNLYLSGFAVKHICSPLVEQKIEMVEKLYPMLEELDLSDEGKGGKEIDLLIGADFYGTVIGKEVKKCNEDGLTAMNSKLGWILCGPYESTNLQTSEDEATTVTVTNLIHVTESIGLEEEDTALNSSVEKLWNLEGLGIMCEEKSWVDKCYENFKFVDGRYQVRLPFKDDCRFMEDNYVLAEKRLQNLKKRLDKDPELLKKYH